MSEGVSATDKKQTRARMLGIEPESDVACERCRGYLSSGKGSLRLWVRGDLSRQARREKRRERVLGQKPQ